MRSAALFGCLVAASLSACASSAPDAPTIRVDLKPPADTSCIGVSGFVVDINVASPEAGTLRETRARAKPVLTNADCRLESAVTLPTVDLDQSVDILIEGYDGANGLRVRGTLHLDKLRDAGDQVIELKHAGEGAQPAQVLAIDRAATLLSGKPITSLDSVEVTRQPTDTLLQADRTSPFFGVGEPWAAQVAQGQVLTNGEEVSIRGLVDKTSVVAKATVVSRGNYFELVGL